MKPEQPIRPENTVTITKGTTYVAYSIKISVDNHGRAFVDCNTSMPPDLQQRLIDACSQTTQQYVNEMIQDINRQR